MRTPVPSISPDKEYFTTGEVASLCAVTVDAVRKWVQAGKIRAEHTPGGHHRIQRTHLLAFMKIQQEMTRKDLKKKPFQYCWEFHAGPEGTYEGCHQCLAYQSRARRCYELTKLPPEAGHAKLFCTSVCEECEYYRMVIGERRAVLIVTDRPDAEASLDSLAVECDCHVRFADSEYKCASVIASYRPDYIVVDFSESYDRSIKLATELSKDTRIPSSKIVLSCDAKHLPRECEHIVHAIITDHYTVKTLVEIIKGL